MKNSSQNNKTTTGKKNYNPDICNLCADWNLGNCAYSDWVKYRTEKKKGKLNEDRVKIT